uniref:NADH-ubiquinone oxidoreductase chain 2 n=1 Tax=Thermistis croceocincta TaxID=2604364 RepID=A0A5B9RFN0_9CUCU|nr:NADH dehydrogenase subunit 2 [Thermistis croceocincta]QEG58706.1 NADH dehydrogenase subunit 2 [Thermistis croceocincta]
MLNLYKLMFLSTLIISTLISISSYSWFSMWMGLEINLLSIIPLLSDKNNLYPSESALKYFITQALASSILLFSIILSLNLSESIPLNLNFLSFIMNSALLMKLGAAPFHTWFPEVMEGLNWMNSLIMLTWQKIAPMVLIFYNYNLSNFFLFIILSSTIISGILGLNQISLRKILTYSSINHISWLMSSMMNNQMIWIFYFLIYSIITLNIIWIFQKFEIFYTPQLFQILNSNKLIKLFFLTNFLSLGGLPPFLGFFPKWLVINNLVQNNFYSLSILLIIFTLITLFFYLRITFSSLMINHSETWKFYYIPLNFSFILFNFLSLTGLWTCTLIFYYI